MLLKVQCKKKVTLGKILWLNYDLFNFLTLVARALSGQKPHAVEKKIILKISVESSQFFLHTARTCSYFFLPSSYFVERLKIQGKNSSCLQDVDEPFSRSAISITPQVWKLQRHMHAPRYLTSLYKREMFISRHAFVARHITIRKLGGAEDG